MFIALASLKGGAGKTTTAIHLAGALAARRGTRVVLIDGDHTRAATGWAKRGPGFDFDVRPVGSDTRDATHVIVDTAAGEQPDDLIDLARHADRVVVPAVPSALDLVVALSTVRLLAPHADTRAVLVKTPPPPQVDASEARDVFEGNGQRVLKTEIRRRKLYEIAALEGVLVRDVRDRDAAILWAAWPSLLREVLS